MVLLLDYMVLGSNLHNYSLAITILIVINARLVYKFIYKLALISILLSKCKFYSYHDFGMFNSFSSNK